MVGVASIRTPQHAAVIMPPVLLSQLNTAPFKQCVCILVVSAAQLDSLVKVIEGERLNGEVRECDGGDMRYIHEASLSVNLVHNVLFFFFLFAAAGGRSIIIRPICFYRNTGLRSAGCRWNRFRLFQMSGQVQVQDREAGKHILKFSVLCSVLHHAAAAAAGPQPHMLHQVVDVLMQALLELPVSRILSSTRQKNVIARMLSRCIMLSLFTSVQLRRFCCLMLTLI